MLEEALLNNPETVLNMKMKDENLIRFTKDVLKNFGTKKKFKNGDKLAWLIHDKYTKDKMINPQSEAGWIQPLYAAAYLHDIFYKKSEPITSLVKAREVLMPTAIELGVQDPHIELMFQAIEGQLGNDTPIPALMPRGDHPIKVFADLRWLVEERGIK